MASKFQKQLVGTVVLVTASVIFIPSLLDGQKRYNETQEKAIPLIPDPSEASAQWQYDPTAFTANSELANEIPEHIEAPNFQLLNPAGEYAQTDNLTINQTVNQQAFNGNNQQGVAQQLNNQAGQLQQNTNTQSVPVNQPKSQNQSQTVDSTKPVQPSTEQNRTNVANRTQTQEQPANSGAINNQSAANTNTTINNTAINNTSTQSGQYVIQLAALSNASKANEIVQKLSAAGYSAYTVPSNKLTRIYVGPSQSRKELNNKLADLNRITGLQGQVVKTK